MKGAVHGLASTLHTSGGANSVRNTSCQAWETLPMGIIGASKLGAASNGPITLRVRRGDGSVGSTSYTAW